MAPTQPTHPRRRARPDDASARLMGQQASGAAVPQAPSRRMRRRGATTAALCCVATAAAAMLATQAQAFLTPGAPLSAAASSALLGAHQQHPSLLLRRGRPSVLPRPHPSAAPQQPRRLALWVLKAEEDENAAIWGLTDLGNANFGKFGSENDPHRNIQPILMDPNAAWKQQDGVDFLPELNEIRQRIQGVNVYLVGMMGSGKTTVGRMLAEGLGAYRWMDLDQFIEGKMQKTAAQVFAEDGEEVWRKQENIALGAMQTFVQTVVSTGGGVMQRRENLPFLHSGLIVWLDLPPDGIVARMQESGEIAKRPLLANAEDPVAELRKLYDERKPNYMQADVRVVLRAEDDAVRCLKRVVHRIIEELDLRPPKAKMWEEKRNKMKNLWDQMKAKGMPTDINAVPEDEDESNPAISAIAELQGGDVSQNKQQQSSKGFGKDVRNKKGGAKAPTPSPAGSIAPAPAAVGSQGVGFGLGLDEYMNGGKPQEAAAPEEGEAGAAEAA